MRHNFPVRLILLGALCLASFSTAADAGIVLVYKTGDNAAGSLRQAIQDAAPGDTIVFHIPTSEPGYDPFIGGFIIRLTSGELVINKNLTIDGGGQKIWVQRFSGTSRIFFVNAGTVVTFSGLTIVQGRGPSFGGGGIANGGTLTIRNCTFSENQAASGEGGAIYSEGILRVSNSTFSGNSALQAGAISNGPSATMQIDNCTVSGNDSSSVGSALGAILNRGSAAAARMRNTIVVGNFSPDMTKDVYGAFTSEGYNLIGTTVGSTGFGATGDQLGATGAQANLGALQNNGGPTLTMRPLPGSVAIDQGKRGLDANNQPINTDQRGYVRPVDLAGIPNAIGGDGSDIGAVETAAAQTGPTFTVTNADGHADDHCDMDDCTLLDAIVAANANSDANTILFKQGVGPIITPQFEPSITRPLNIIGPGARQLSLHGAASHRIFTITPAASSVSISGLTLTNGFANGDGGGIYNVGPELTVTDCTIFGSQAQTSGGNGGNGGGLYNSVISSTTLLRCTIVNNAATGFGGGAVFNTGHLTATNCTFYANTAPSGGGILSVSNNGNSLTTLRNCTVTNNTASSTGSSTAGGGGYYGEGAVGNSLHHFSNTILAGNFNANNPDLRGFGTTEGNNLVGNLGQGGSGFTNGVNGDKVGVSPNFDAFGNNGGQTDTWSILGNSPAVNAGNSSLAPATDQRRHSRSGVSDIGAFEFNGTAPPLVPISSVVSSKVHGAQTFGINLPLSGSPGVECRSGGANGDFTVVFTSANTLANIGGVSLTSGAGAIALATGINSSDAHQYIVALTGIVNAQVATLQLANVNDSLGNNTPVLQVPIGFLLGDSTGNGIVNATDVSQVKLQSGQAVSGSNFRNDINVNGSINATDVSSVKSKSGTALP